MLGNFFMVVAAILIALSFKAIIHTLLISKSMSDKPHKNVGLIMLFLGAAVFGTAVIVLGIYCSWYLSTLQQKTVLACEMEDRIADLLKNLDLMTYCTAITAALYGAIRLLVKNIEKDVEVQHEKPMERWGPLVDKIR